MDTALSTELGEVIACFTPESHDLKPVHYDETNDQLLVFFGQSNHRSVIEVEIFPRTRVLLLNQSQKHEDPLAGLRIGPGIQSFVQSIYENFHTHMFETYRMRHNRKTILTTIASIFSAIREQHQPIGKGDCYLQRIDHAFAELHNLVVHIPLKPHTERNQA